VLCVFYGPELEEPVIGKTDSVILSKHLRAGHWRTMRVNLRLPDGGEEMALIREVQRHPLSGQLLHVDFMRLLKGRRITVNVPVEIVGQAKSPGVKEGGVVEHVREIEVETLPTNIPEKVVVDVSELTLNSSIHIKDLAISDVEILLDPEEVVVSVVLPRAETAEEEAPHEVEVVTKGKASKGEE
jgi:large subunit ribosomal protein L25